MATRASLIVEGDSELVDDLVALAARADASRVRPGSGQLAAALAAAHPERRRCRVRLFLIPGRAGVAAILNPRLPGVGLLGCFEAPDPDDLEASRAVLDAASAWLIAQGVATVRGPVRFSTWNDYRFVVERADATTFAGEPDHPAHYLDHWRAAGFAPCARYGSFWVEDPAGWARARQPRVAACRAGGVGLRTASAADLPAIFTLANREFRDNYLFTPLEPDEFAAIYSGDRASAAGDLTFIATLDERPVGFLYNFMAELGGETVGILKSIAIAGPARDRGVFSLLFSAAFEAFVARGARRAIAGLVHTDGGPASMGWQSGAPYKQYVLLERS